MLIFVLLWILLLIILIELIVYRPLVPIELLFFIGDANGDTGTQMSQTGDTLTRDLTLPKNTRTLEIVIYNNNTRDLITCDILQGNKLIGRQGLISKQGYSRILVDIQRSFDHLSPCTISLGSENTLSRNDILLKLSTAWMRS